MARNALGQLRKLIIRNKKLDAILGEKIAKAEQNQQWTYDFSQRDIPQTMDSETQRQLRSHGFDFSQPLRASASPNSDSIPSDGSYHSPAPLPNQTSPVVALSPFRYQSENWEREQQLSLQAQHQNHMLDSGLQQGPGPGLSITPDLFNQLQRFDEGTNAFGMDVSLDSGDFDISGWPGESGSTNQQVNVSPTTTWQFAQESPFHH